MNKTYLLNPTHKLVGVRLEERGEDTDENSSAPEQETMSKSYRSAEEFYKKRTVGLGE